MKHLRTLELILDVARSGSVRKTAERLAITPSALTRKIQDFEWELGTPIFERVPQGMRLNTAGELVVRHARGQRADFERVRSQIADLSGMRRGHVAIACSQAFADNVMPDEIADYRAQHPLVSFTLQVRDHAHAVQALAEYEADLALVLQPPPAPELRVLHSIAQPLCALMGEGHPLAAQRGTVRLRDCLRHPLAMPDRGLAIRHLLDAAIVRAGLPVEVAVESGSLEFLRNYARRNQAVSFQVPAGIPTEARGLVARPIDERDMARPELVLGQLRGRALSVAAAKFADQIMRNMERQREAPLPSRFLG